MALIILVGLALLWFSLDQKVWRDRKQWPKIALALLGLILMVKGRPFVGAALLGGVALWSRWPHWQAKRGNPALRLARSEACDLLGVPANADRETIIAAHRRLIARNHPDNGGTEGLAARLNAARDTLLREQVR